MNVLIEWEKNPLSRSVEKVKIPIWLYIAWVLSDRTKYKICKNKWIYCDARFEFAEPNAYVLEKS
jgi:hypothetical protein